MTTLPVTTYSLGEPSEPQPLNRPDRNRPGLPGAATGEPQPVPVALLGVPFDGLTSTGTLEVIDRMIASGRPHYVATANVDFIVQALGDLELRRILGDADLVLCDGTPLVWASRVLGNPLPERVAGSDLVPLLLAESERRGWRVFFLGGAAESLAQAEAKVRARHPRLQLVGAYSPPFQHLLEMDHDDIRRRVQEARPDILLVAFGCPKQEKWISMHFRRLGVPVSIGVGATIDFLAGTVRRAPVWMQRSGMEWVFRLGQEPRRLFRRYVTDLWVISRAILRQGWQLRRRAPLVGSADTAPTARVLPGLGQLVCPGDRLDAAHAAVCERLWNDLPGNEVHCLLDLSRLESIDSTGMGLLLRWQKRVRDRGGQLVLIAPTEPVKRAVKLMRFTEFLPSTPDLAAARELVTQRQTERSVVNRPEAKGSVRSLGWQGDIVASRAEQILADTLGWMGSSPGQGTEMEIDLSGVRFIDSTGVGLMVRVRREALERGVQLRFTGPSPAVRNVLRILRMEAKLLA